MNQRLPLHCALENCGICQHLFGALIAAIRGKILDLVLRAKTEEKIVCGSAGKVEVLAEGIPP